MMEIRAEKYSLGFECGIWADDKFWFADMRENALYCWNRETVRFAGHFIEEEGERLFWDVKLYGNKLLFIPLLANKIAVYDRKEEWFSYIPLPFERSAALGLFSSSVIWNDYLYMLPFYYPGIVKVNLQNGNMELLDAFGLENEDAGIELTAPYFRGGFCQVGEKLYIPFMRNSGMLEFDLSCDKGCFIEIGVGSGFSAMVQAEDRFWLFSHKQKEEEKTAVVCWNRISNTVEAYPIDFPAHRLVSACGSVYAEGYCRFFLTHPNKVLKIKMDTGEISEDALFADINNAPITPFSTWGSSYIYCQNYNDGVLLFEGKGSKMIWFKPNTGEIKSWSLMMPKERRPFYKKTISKLYNNFLQEDRKTGIYHETPFFGLNEMIEELLGEQ